MSNTANIFIASRQRIGGTASNFSVNLQPLISRVQSFSLKECTIDFSWYVIRAPWTIFTYEETGGVPVSIALDEGSPSLTSLCSELVTKLDAATAVASTYSCTVDPDTQKLSITATGASSATFRVLPQAAEYELYYALGFVDPETGDLQTTAAGATQTGASIMHLSGGNAVYLESSALNLNSIGNNQFRAQAGDPNSQTMRRTNAFAQIPIDVNFGGTIVYRPSFPTVYPFRGDNMSQIDIKLTDERGNVLPLNGGQINLQLVITNNDN